MEIEATIQRLIEKDLLSLETHLQEWARKYLVQPNLVSMLIDPDDTVTKDIWIITSEDGASYQVTFDSVSKMFGLAMILQDGQCWYMGPYGSFNDAIKNM